jgi:CDP-diacylglycerol--glycerol-3-phosphate 3-phosphatidyltransferase
MGISPNAVTVAGTVGVCIGAVGFGARGYVFTATVIVTLSAFTDLIDGAMARARGSTGKFGALLDSTMDRLADGVIFASVAYWFASQGQHSTAAAAMLCLVSGVVVSYVKARAEGLGFRCDVGIVERAERLIAVGVGALLHVFGVPHGFEVVLWALALMSVVTVGQRIFHVYQADQALLRARAATPQPADTP